MIGVKAVTDDSQMAHSALATKLQSDRNYKKEYEDNKTKYSASLDMMNISQAKKAQDLATETNYRTILHEYTTLPSDMKVEWAKKAYGQQSEVRIRYNNILACLIYRYAICESAQTVCFFRRKNTGQI